MLEDFMVGSWDTVRLLADRLGIRFQFQMHLVMRVNVQVVAE